MITAIIIVLSAIAGVMLFILFLLAWDLYERGPPPNPPPKNVHPQGDHYAGARWYRGMGE